LGPNGSEERPRDDGGCHDHDGLVTVDLDLIEINEVEQRNAEGGDRDLGRGKTEKAETNQRDGDEHERDAEGAQPSLW
jgi:hypothetical protein